MEKQKFCFLKDINKQALQCPYFFLKIMSLKNISLNIIYPRPL